MEDDFRFIAGHTSARTISVPMRSDCCADRLAERDVDIIERGQQLAKVIEEYKDLVARQKYCEQEMQRLEALVNVRLPFPLISVISSSLFSSAAYAAS